MNDVPLPGMPDPPPAPVRKEVTGERISRYNPTRDRKLCDVCVFLIHQYGQGAAPYPKHARWRVVRRDDSKYVCNDHRETRL